MLIGPDGWAGDRGRRARPRHGLRVLPGSLGNCLRRAWEYTGGAVPLSVTENGIGTTDDEQRIDYVRQALSGVLDVMAEGVDVRGYTYWSLLDNFEWALGTGPSSAWWASIARPSPDAEAQRRLAVVGRGLNALDA